MALKQSNSQPRSKVTLKVKVNAPTPTPLSLPTGLAASISGLLCSIHHQVTLWCMVPIEHQRDNYRWGIVTRKVLF